MSKHPRRGATAATAQRRKVVLRENGLRLVIERERERKRVRVRE